MRRKVEEETRIDKIQTDVKEPDGASEKPAELNTACHLNLLLMWNRETTARNVVIVTSHTRAHTLFVNNLRFCGISGIVVLQTPQLVGARNV